MENHYNCIYMYINKINGHKYVGQAKDFNKRHSQHLYESKNKNKKEYNYPFNYAIRKYGIDNFEVKILAENISTNKIDDYEKFFIKRYKSLKTQNGYNVASGGYENPFAGKTKEEMDKTRQKMSESHKGEKHHLYGKKHSEESKQRMSKSHKGKIISEETKQKMSDVKKGKRKSEEHKTNISKSHIGKSYNFKKIKQYDKDGNLIKIWNSIKEANIELKIDNSAITKCCKGKSKTCGGFIWKYYEKD